MEPGRLSIGTPQELAAEGALSRFVERPGIRFCRDTLTVTVDR
jgi:iron complex transport system ATP-binding protein